MNATCRATISKPAGVGARRAIAAGAVALALSIGCAAAPAEAQTISISTPPQGSVWNTMATVFASRAREDSDLALVVQPYGGNAAMMQALQQELAEFSLNDINDVITAVAGTGEYGDVGALPDLRVVARINPFPIGLYVKDELGIEHVSELAGRSVPSGWDAFPLARSHITAILAAGGLTWDDVRGVPVPELIRGSDDMASGRVDSAFFALGGPKVAEVDAAVGGVRFLEVDDDPEALARIQEVRPAFYFSRVEPAPFRVGVDEPMAFVTWDNVLLAGAHVPDETIATFLRVLADGRDALAEAYPPLGAFSIERAYKAYPGVEYHPGAIAFYEERGVALAE